MRKSAIGIIVFFIGFAMVCTGTVDAAGYPGKRLTYNICFNPGGASDITARFQEPVLKKHFGQDVVISYKIGGGGALCWAELVQTKPDGYTIAGHNLPHIVLQPLEMGNTGYKTLDLKSIYFFESTPNLLVVRNDSPYKTLKDLVEYAKKNPPGVVTVGGSGSSTSADLGNAMFNKAFWAVT
jgi:tripartite-type tricarboxylate transporter receptor subunit TctC